LPGGDTLPRLLNRLAGAPLRRPKGGLTVEQILEWADAHHRRSGRWPTYHSGPVWGVEGETWAGIDNALRKAQRKLPRTSLPALLAERRGKVPRRPPAPLTAEMILGWADAHRRRTGRCPSAASGAVKEAPAEDWRALDMALRGGFRGLPGGDSLAQLLERERGAHRWAPWRAEG
jgi:hypothetical protein